MSAGTKIANALGDVAASVDKTESTSMMGIKGVMWTNLTNVGAMVIIAGAFLYLGQDVVKQSKEDRIMFRDELKALRVSQEARWEKTEITHGRSMEKMWNTVERAVNSMEEAVKELRTTTAKIQPSVIRPAVPPHD